MQHFHIHREYWLSPDTNLLYHSDNSLKNMDIEKEKINEGD